MALNRYWNGSALTGVHVLRRSDKLRSSNSSPGELEWLAFGLGFVGGYDGAAGLVLPRRYSARSG
jgi:hypothetical protein